MSRTNAMSTLGRMSWGVHALFYPTTLALYFGAWKPYTERSEKAAKEQEWEEMCKAKPVDPDHFNPFTPVPFSNNPELKYFFANVNMRSYLNKEQISERDYMWKSYHNVYDHGNAKSYQWNWSSI